MYEEDQMQKETFSRERDPNFSFKYSIKVDEMLNSITSKNNMTMTNKNNNNTNNMSSEEFGIKQLNSTGQVKTVNVRDNIKQSMQNNQNQYTNNSKHIKEEEEEPQRLIEDNIESLKNFRKNGFINNTNKNITLEDKVNTIYELEKEKSLKLEEDKKFKNELEKRR